MFQPHRSQSGTFSQHLLHMMTKILIFVRKAVHVDVRIPRHADNALCMNLAVVENPFRILINQFLQQNIPHPVSRQENQPLLHRRHRDDTIRRLVADLQLKHDVDRLIDKMRERMMCIYNLRGQNREYICYKVFFRKASLLGRKTLHLRMSDPLFTQKPRNLSVNLITLFIQRCYRTENLRKLLGGIHPRLIIDLRFRQERLIVQTPDTDHKEFIQIAGKNRNEFQFFKCRNIFFSCLFQDSFIEPKPGKLSVLRVNRILHFPITTFLYKYPSLTPKLLMRISSQSK